VFTLRVQGGPMSIDEARAFENQAFARDAVAVRRWDEAAKDPSAPTPDFDHFRPLLERLIDARGRRDMVQR
jgi:gamma-butyrobetaine dioxygenase